MSGTQKFIMVRPGRKLLPLFSALLLMQLANASVELSEAELLERCRLKNQEERYPNCMTANSSTVLWCDQSNYTRILAPGTHRSKYVTREDAQKAEILYINDSCLLEISRGDLREYNLLRELHASQNYITRLRKSAFRHNAELTKIDFSNNLITEIESGSFEGLVKLLELDLGNNKINEIDAYGLRHLGTLEKLSLAKNKLTVLDRRPFRGMTNLKELDLTENKILRIRDGFKGLSKLEYLYLDGNKLTEVETKTFSGVPSLRKLSLSHNEISTWPESSDELFNHLCELNLSSNLINEFKPVHTAHMKELSYLSLGNNSLSKIDIELFSTNSDLKFLNLSGNFIEDIPGDTFASLRQLETLLLEDNWLKTPNKRWFLSLSKQSSPDVNVGGDHWDCNCDILEFKDFLNELQDSESAWDNALARKLEIRCSKPKMAAGEILDEYVADMVTDPSRCNYAIPPPEDVPNAVPSKTSEITSTITSRLISSTASSQSKPRITPRLEPIYKDYETTKGSSTTPDSASFLISIIVSLSSVILIVLGIVVVCFKLKRNPLKRAKSASRRKRNESSQRCVEADLPDLETGLTEAVSSDDTSGRFSRIDGGNDAVFDPRDPIQQADNSTARNSRSDENAYMSMRPGQNNNACPRQPHSRPAIAYRQVQYHTTVPKRLYSEENTVGLTSDDNVTAVPTRRQSTESFQSCKDFSSDFRGASHTPVRENPFTSDINCSGPPSSFDFFSIESRACGDGAEKVCF